jgi:hypothetical protein
MNNDSISLPCPMNDTETPIKDGFYTAEGFSITMNQLYQDVVRVFDCSFTANSSDAYDNIVIEIKSISYADQEYFNLLLK